MPALDPVIGIVSRAWGPDFGLLGRDRHVILLRRLFRELPQREYGKDLRRPWFSLTIDGRFSSEVGGKPVTDRVRLRRIDDDGWAYVDFGVSLETQLLSEDAFRTQLAGMFLIAANSLIEFAKKKGLNFDEERYLFDVESVVREYLAFPLPLPTPAAEIELAEFFGVPTQEPAG